MRLWLEIFFAMLLLIRSGKSQGFLNLNFESATVISDDPPNFVTIYANSAIPAWTAYLGGIAESSIFYNGVSLGGAAVILQHTNSSFGGQTPLQGQYSILLEGSGLGTPTTASIGQTGQIPSNTLSLLFYQSLLSSLQVTFNGQVVPLYQTGATANYAIMGGDISAFAGQTGQLLFSALPNIGNALLDKIQFPPQPFLNHPHWP